ncbi:hypothetical protein FRB90_006753, partial [Tulasnella sp. 427]
SASISLASVSSTSVLAQQTTTTKEDKPTTTTHRTTTTTHKAKPTADSNDDDDDDNSGSSGGKTYNGDGTFYSTGLNACGTYDKDSDYIAAADHALFDSFPWGALDFSPDAFEQMAPFSVGRFHDLEWSFL